MTEISALMDRQGLTRKNLCEISQKAFPAQISSNKGETTVSIYQGEIAAPNHVAIAMARLKTAFPKMDVSFFNLLAERVIENGFTEQRLKDAVNNIIDNFSYKELTVADIIKYDQRMRLYTHNDVCIMVSKGLASFDDFEVKKINGKYYRIKKNGK